MNLSSAIQKALPQPRPLWPDEGCPDEETFYKAQARFGEIDSGSYRFGLGMPIIWTRKVPLAATDGWYQYYNPDTYIRFATNSNQRAGLHFHEGSHKLLRHMQRGKRYEARGHFRKRPEFIPFDWYMWNCAGDYAINALGQHLGFELVMHPEFRMLTDDRFDHTMTCDEIYIALWKEQQSKQQEQDDQSGEGEPQDGDGEESEEDANADTSGGDATDADDDSQDPSTDPGDSGEQDDGDEAASGGSGADEDGEEGEATGSSDSGEPEDAGDGSGSAGESGEPQATPSAGHDQHLEPDWGDATPEEIAEAEAEHERRTQQEADLAIDEMFRQGGKQWGGDFATAGLRHCGSANMSGINWARVVADWLTSLGSGGKPDPARFHRRRFANYGIIMPRRKGRVRNLAFTVDITGSVSDEQCDRFRAHAAYLIDLIRPTEGALILWTNTRVVRADRAMTGSQFLALEAPGGGDNRLAASLEWLEQNGYRPERHVLFTDGYTPLSDFEAFAKADVLVVLDRDPDRRVKPMLDKSGVKWVAMD
jgi:predicted metal-dependent peptidase